MNNESTTTNGSPTVSPRDQLVRDTLSTCIEGGSAYWLDGRPKRLMDTGKRFINDGEPWHYAGVTHCLDAEDGTAFADITIATIEAGFLSIVDGTVRVRAGLAGAIIVAWHLPDDADIDAEAADAVLQAGLFGDLVYG